MTDRWQDGDRPPMRAMTWCWATRVKGMSFPQTTVSESLRLYLLVTINTWLATVDEVLSDGMPVMVGRLADCSAYPMARMEGV